MGLKKEGMELHLETSGSYPPFRKNGLDLFVTQTKTDLPLPECYPMANELKNHQ